MIKNRRMDAGENKLRSKRMKIWRELLDLGMFLRGSICTLKRPCTRKRCARCKAGTKHPTTYFSVKQGGKTTLIYLPKSAERTTKHYIKRGEQARLLLDKLLGCDIELLRLEIKKKIAQ